LGQGFSPSGYRHRSGGYRTASIQTERRTTDGSLDPSRA
jgi:hypothetical protein